MKKLEFYRKNEFWGRGINIKVFVNNESYDLPNNSKIEVKNFIENPEIQAKYLWYRSKKLRLNSNNEVLKIRVKQIFSNIQLLISFVAIATTFILHQLYNDEIFEYFFFGTGIAFLSYMFFFLTLGCKYYFTFSINEHLN